MIHENPADRLLRNADQIVLFDVSIPGWRRVVVNNLHLDLGRRLRNRVIEIPVDLTDQAAIKCWHERIRQIRD